MFSEETSVFSVECYFAMFSDIAKTGSGSSRALSELVEFIFPLPYKHAFGYPTALLQPTAARHIVNKCYIIKTFVDTI